MPMALQACKMKKRSGSPLYFSSLQIYRASKPLNWATPLEYPLKKASKQADGLGPKGVHFSKQASNVPTPNLLQHKQTQMSGLLFKWLTTLQLVSKYQGFHPLAAHPSARARPSAHCSVRPPLSAHPPARPCPPFLGPALSAWLRPACPARADVCLPARPADQD